MVDVRDPSWDTDLLWHYFHEVSTPAKPRGDWYKGMDPGGELSDRHHVYEILVHGGAQTNPASDAETAVSKIPWNQNNGDFLKTVGGAEYCGSIVKIVFTRYMGWSGKEPTPVSVAKKGFDAASWTIDKLKRNIPVRVGFGGQHYVGIVGHRCVVTNPLPAGVEGPRQCSSKNEFLCIEPWAGGVMGSDSITFAGETTSFLGIIKQNGSNWQYGTLAVTWVEA